jgi:hypothetical protein
MERTNIKIIQIGFNKCGTQSLNEYYELNGFKCVHWDSGKLAKTIKSNHRLGKRILEGYENYDFISDMEIVNDHDDLILAFKDYFKNMECQYPDAKFILNTRNVFDWISSRAQHGGSGDNNYLKRYMRKLNLSSDQVLKLWMREWYEHHFNVISYFQGMLDKLLIFDIDRPDHEALARFSGLTKGVAFPRVDRTKQP